MTFSSLAILVTTFALAEPAAPASEGPDPRAPAAESPSAEAPAQPFEQPAEASPDSPATEPDEPAPGGAGLRASDLGDPFRRPEPAPGDQPAAAPSQAGPEPAPTARRRMRHKTWPDRPIRYRIELAFDGGTNLIFDPGYRGFHDSRNLPGFGFALRTDFRLANGPVFLGGGLGYRQFSTDHQIHQGALDTSLVLREPVVLARLSIMTLEGIDVFAELSGGPSIIDLAVSGDQSADQRKVSGYFTGLVGPSLYLPKKWLPRKGSSRLTGGLEAGIGYSFRPALDVAPSADVDADDSIDTDVAALGDVFVRGLAWRAGIFVRFM